MALALFRRGSNVWLRAFIFRLLLRVSGYEFTLAPR